MMKRFLNHEVRQEIWYTIRANKRRTLMTSLGVFAGMFFFTFLTGIGQGIENSIRANLETSSSEMQMIFGSRTTMPYQGYKANRQITTTYGDFLALKKQATLIDKIEGTAGFGGRVDSNTTRVIANGKSQEENVQGVSAGYIPNILQAIVVAGRYMHPDEIDRGENICVIGTNTSVKFFDTYEEAVGQYMIISGIAFRIVGVMTPYSDAANIGFNLKYVTLVPLVFAVNNSPNAACQFPFVRKPGVTPDAAADQMITLLSDRHHVHPEDKKAFVTVSMQMITRIFEMVVNVINVLVWVVALGTLFSGVISVSNILLVTVRERQREIGVRRAIGAKPSDIRWQFMLESIFIILLAGSAGMLVALTLNLGIGALADATQLGNFIQAPYPSPLMMVLSVIIMLLSGLLAGLLPVHQALKIKAIDAIRDE